MRNKITLLNLFFLFFIAFANAQVVTISDQNGNNNIATVAPQIKIDCNYNFVPTKKVQLTATFSELKSPTTYVVAPVTYVPTGLFNAGNSIAFDADDEWSINIPIGFLFCFYGNTYSSLNVADNGILCFGYNATLGGGSFSLINNTVPSPSLIKNAIFAGFQDYLVAPVGFGCYDPEDNCGTIDLNANVKNNNNIVWKNISVVDDVINNIVNPIDGVKDDQLMGATIIGGDAGGTGGLFDFEFTDPTVYQGNPVSAEAEIKITQDEPIWIKWANGGFQGTNIEIIKEDKHQIIVKGKNGKIKNLLFAPNERGLLNVSFNFLAKKLSGQPEFDYLNYVRYFTPNEDGYNDRWNIKGIKDQPNAKVYIFDRFEKLLKQLSTSDGGWDGTYLGNMLPSDDYWFTVTYEENGEQKQFKSHFAMKR